MLWRAPWLRYRLGLIGLAAWDAASLYLSYNMTHLTRLGTWRGFSLGFLVVGATWLGVSYLAGRYSKPNIEAENTFAIRLVKTIIAATFVILVFVLHSWAYQVIDAQTRFRGFLVPVVMGAAILSTIGQELINSYTQKKRRWLLIANQEEKKVLLQEIGVESEELGNRTLVKSEDESKDSLVNAERTYISLAVGSLGAESNDLIRRLLEFRGQGKLAIPLSTWCEQELHRIPPEVVRTDWLVQAEGFGLRPGSLSWRVKRAGDIAGACGLIISTLPILLVCAVLVYLEDRGPVLYSQVRTGLYGEPIRIWKLRSMSVNAEMSGPRWSSKSDPRVTRIGKVIRATRIDELPQLLSVISGDLSLIGPRPERPEFEEGLEKEIRHYRIRHWIRPGLSGWAQVMHPYGASISDSRQKLAYDIYYLRNAGFLLDILIIFKTIRLVIRGEGSTPRP